MADIYSRIGQPDSYPDAEPRTDATTTLHAFAEATLRPIIAG